MRADGCAGRAGAACVNPKMYPHQPVARETVETAGAPHPSYALAVLRAASPGVAGRGGAQFSSVSLVLFSSVQLSSVQFSQGFRAQINVVTSPCTWCELRVRGYA